MSPFLRVSRGIDRFSDRIGKMVGWAALFMVLIGAFNAILRYIGKIVGRTLTSDLALDLQWNLFSVVFLLGAGYALRCGAHVRVDVLYGRISPRAQAVINLVGTLAFLLPLSVTMLWFSWPSIHNAWKVLETMSNAGQLPIYPIKTCILLSFVLLIVQAFSELIKCIASLTGALPAGGPGAADAAGSDSNNADRSAASAGEDNAS